MIRRSMTYGVLPTMVEFHQAWEDLEQKGELKDGRFDVARDPYAGTDSYTCQELWRIVWQGQKEWQGGSEQAGEFCSTVLAIFGFEWI